MIFDNQLGEDKKGYLGNAQLKRTGEQIPWTKELLEEYMKCAEDPIYFGERYMKIVVKGKGLQQIDMYDYQREIATAVMETNSVVAECARQSGKSTIMTVVILWYILFHEHVSVAILANKADTSREILSRIKLAYEHLPDWIQHGVKEWNKGNIELENGSKILAAATSSNNIRGFSIDMLFIDEAAFIDGWDDFFTSVYPTISSSDTTKLILVSTVNGLNHFHRITSLARQDVDPMTKCGVNGFRLISVPWNAVPGRDEEWKQKTLAGMQFDTERFAQEFENEYLGSSGTLISGPALKMLVEGVSIPGLEHESAKIYEEYKPGHEYVMTVDVSRGRGLDYSAFQLIDVTEMPFKQVAVYRDNNQTPIDFAQVVFRFATHYGNAAVLVEVNDIGGQVSDILWGDFQYDNLLCTDNAGSRGQVITTNIKSSTYRGIRTSKTTKSKGCALLKLLIEQKQLIVQDHDTIHELSTFSKKGRSYEAEPGHNDDLVMCLVMFAWLSHDQYFKLLTDHNTAAELRQRRAEQIEEALLPFGFSTDSSPSSNIADDLELSKHTDENWFADDSWMFR